MMKSTEQRDIYAEALLHYRANVPVEKWPTTGRNVSKSGLEREMRSRGFTSFDRKRLLSSKCAPIMKEMEASLAEYLGTISQSAVVNQVLSEDPAAVIEIKRLSRRISGLEKELSNAVRREKVYREKCALLEAEIEMIKSRRDAFEAHCASSLRTIHL